MNIRQQLRSYSVLYKTYGWLTYALFRAKLRLSEWQEQRIPTAAGDLPLPPPMLRFRVGGSFDRAFFLGIGRSCADALRELARRAGKDLDRCGAVLDFACGCGRVIRHFRNHAPDARWYGSEIDTEAIQWCRENLGSIATFSQNGFQPPTDFEDDSFEVIYSISLFTHLDEEDQFRWLAELARVLRKGGILIATTHGPFTHQQLPPEDAQKLSADGFLYRVGQTGKLKLDGLPDFYQTAYHTEQYIRERWGKLFEIVAYQERAIGDYQDAVVLRKRGGD